MAAVGLLAFVSAGAAFAYGALQGNIDRYDVADLLGEDRPAGVQASDSDEPADPRAGRPFNVLVMGSDIRTGENAVIGGTGAGMRSDTTLVVHISADRSRADIISIPRDLLVDIPACQLPNGSQSWAQDDAMFNSAFSIGGETGDVAYAAACTIKTVEQMSGVFIDDFVVVDFAGFTRMVDALGGIPMCIPEPLSDSYAGLDLDAGFQTLNGADALAYARARKNVGDGSDISRIGRQQVLLGAMVRQVLSKNLLTDLPALYQFLDAATESVSAGPEVGQIPNLVGLANSLRSVPAGGVSFVTVPFDWAGNRVRPNADSEALWTAIAADEPIAPAPDTDTDTDTDATGSPETEATPSTGVPTESPSADPEDQPWDIITGEDEAGICG